MRNLAVSACTIGKDNSMRTVAHHKIGIAAAPLERGLSNPPITGPQTALPRAIYARRFGRLRVRFAGTAPLAQLDGKRPTGGR
jgi:hypothetical protein